MARKRFRNKTDRIQLIYDESGNKRELIPKGTVVLEEKWGRRYSRILELVQKSRRAVQSGRGEKAGTGTE